MLRRYVLVGCCWICGEWDAGSWCAGVWRAPLFKISTLLQFYSILFGKVFYSTRVLKIILQVDVSGNVCHCWCSSLRRSDRLGKLNKFVDRKNSVLFRKDLLVTKKEHCAQPSLIQQLLSKKYPRRKSLNTRYEVLEPVEPCPVSNCSLLSIF